MFISNIDVFSFALHIPMLDGVLSAGYVSVVCLSGSLNWVWRWCLLWSQTFPALSHKPPFLKTCSLFSPFLAYAKPGSSWGSWVRKWKIRKWLGRLQVSKYEKLDYNPLIACFPKEHLISDKLRLKSFFLDVLSQSLTSTLLYYIRFSLGLGTGKP
jgi:hypothetical protein